MPGKTFDEDWNHVSVGDLNSDAKGSGARKNGGKPQLDLIPVRQWLQIWKEPLENKPELRNLLEYVMLWQEGHNTALDEWLTTANPAHITAAVTVLEFGAHKYKAWNWAKGMPWSICTGCVLRHAQKCLIDEIVDLDSGIAHWGHIICNIIFLAHYAHHYPEGDDRPPSYN